MFEWLKEILSGKAESRTEEEVRENAALATAVIFMEAVRADGSFSEEEKKIVKKFLSSDFNMSEADTENLIQEAARINKNETNKWKYKSTLNKLFTNDEKEELLEKVWRLVFADDRMDKYENQLMHTLAGVLHIPHSRLIQAKLRASGEGYK